jgi:hypothetical protein
MWLAVKLMVGAWAGLNFLDDAATLFRVVRLVAVSFPFAGSRDSSMCDLCDDVMADTLIRGAEGLDALPCTWICLAVPGCVRMCETVKAFSGNTSRFPCEAAGYCEPGTAEQAFSLTSGCSVAPIFRCKPARYCTHRRHGFRFSCELKPGIGRWVGMREGVRKHAGAIVSALYEQPRCGEAGAGVYCIASPRGPGAAAEILCLLFTLG